MTVRRAASYALAAIAVLLIVFALDLVLLLFAAVIVAVILSSLANALARITHLPRGVALAIVVVLILAGFAALFWLASPAIYEELMKLRALLPEALQRLQEAMKRFTWLETILNALPTGDTYMQRPGVGGRLVGGTLSAIINVFVVLIIGVYLAATPCVYVDGLARLFPLSQRTRAHEVLAALYDTLRGWLGGMLIAMSFVAIAMSVGLWILGIPLPFTLGLIAGMFEFIPNIGPMLGGVPAALLALTAGPSHVLYVIALVALIQSAESYVVTPIVMKRVISLPPALTLVAQVVGALTAGWLGLLLATPAVAMVMVLVQMVYLESILGEKNARGEQAEHASEPGCKAPDR